MKKEDFSEILKSDDDKKQATEKAKAIASRLSSEEIDAIKKCAAKAGSIKELFSDPEFRKIISRTDGQ